jgi:hypothetical protein
VLDLLRQGSAGLFDFITAFTFLATWIRPEWLGRAWVKSLMLVMLVEFLVVHSFGFLIATTQEGGPKSVWMLLGLGAFYLLFAAAFAAAFRSWWPVLLFGWLIGSKLFALLTGTVEAPVQGVYVIQVWVVSTLAYIAFAILTSLLPLPRLGVREHGHAYGVNAKASGAWVDEPYRVLAFGFLYFICVGIARVYYAPQG